MVRFKNRHLLVEFLSPSNLRLTLGDSSKPLGPAGPDLSDISGNEEDDSLPVLPQLPFLLPIADDQRRLQLGDEGGQVIYRAIRSNVLEVFGDEGWGRLSSSFKVIYHSPLTTLTILRVARPHYRTLWASLTLLREIANQPLIPRVVAVSGTIKKLQNRAIAYHRLITAQALAAALARIGPEEGLMRREEEEKRLRSEWATEEEAMNSLEG